MQAETITQYVELIATVCPNDVERAAEILRSLADSGTWIARPFIQPTLEDNAITNDQAPVHIHVYFRGADAAANAALVPSALGAADIEATCESRAVADDDWAESWKEHFDVERYGERLVVVPSWRSYDPRPADVIITLDPGMAFGTGQHETTRMCLEALERAIKPGMRVLDVGCGSGILSIAAAKLGAAEVLALDIDPDCVRITRENAKRNACANLVDAREGSLGDTGALARRFDVIFANIIAGTIIELASELARSLVGDGRLITSGIIGERESAVSESLQAVGLRIVSARAMGEWRCVEAVPA